MENLMGILAQSLLGICIVFAVLILLIGCIKMMNLFIKKEKTEAKPAAANAAPAQAAKAASNGALAKGSCGDVKIFDVPDKTAAMLMAITADMLKEPLNTLRFISIKEVK